MAVPQVSIVNGSIINPPAVLEFGKPFQWANPVVGVHVGLSGCSGFATSDTYGVPGAPSQGSYGLKDAVMLLTPTNYAFSETPNEWNAPGSPRIIVPPWPNRRNNEETKEVA
jgi:hypothetical protein